MKFPLRLKTALAALALVGLMMLPAIPAAQAVEATGSYKLVGLGPAGLDLATPRAINAIREADIVFIRAGTKEMLAPMVDFSGKQIIEGYNHIFRYYNKPCPKEKDQRMPPPPPDMEGQDKKKQPPRRMMSCEQMHKKQAEFAAMVRKAVAEGKKVVMATSGDPTIYGPCIWTMLELQDINSSVVAGLSAFNAGNAALKAGLGEVIITAPFFIRDRKGPKRTTESLESLASHKSATMVIFMPRDRDKLLARLAEAYPADTPVGVVSYAGYPDKERVLLGTIGDIKRKLDAQGKEMTFMTMIYVGKAMGNSNYVPSKKPKSKGKYYLVGLGPGDPDLATFRALEVIKKADIIFAHRRIKELFAKELAGKNVIEGYFRLFPFYGKPCPKEGEQPQGRRREFMSCEQYHKKQAEFGAMVRKAVAEGKTVAMLDSGDTMVYGPCNWSLTELKDIETEVVPGISCFNAANAALGVGVTEGKTSHSVLFASGWSVEDMAREKATMVMFTMRTEFKKFIDALSKHYAPETPAAVVFNAGYAKDEKVVRGTLGDIMQKVGDKRLPFQHLLYVGDALTNKSPY
jgi:precorrin-4 methylase